MIGFMQIVVGSAVFLVVKSEEKESESGYELIQKEKSEFDEIEALCCEPGFKSLYFWSQILIRIGQTILLVLLSIFAPKYLYQVYSLDHSIAMPIFCLTIGLFIAAELSSRCTEEARSTFGSISMAATGIIFIFLSRLQCHIIS